MNLLSNAFEKRIEYLKMKDGSNLPNIELDNLEDLARLMQKTGNSIVFTGKNPSFSGRSVNRFLIVHEGVIYWAPNFDYKSFEDYRNGMKENYKEGKDYYASIKGGFKNIEEFEDARKRGYPKRSDLSDSKGKKFYQCFEKFKKLEYQSFEFSPSDDDNDYYVRDYYDDDDYDYGRNESDKKTEKAFLTSREFEDLQYQMETEGDIYFYAMNKGFPNYDECLKCLINGFNSYGKYQDAFNKGFTHSLPYRKALKGNFDNADEFFAAREVRINNKEEYQLYKELEKIQKQFNFSGVNTAHVYKILSEFDQGRKLSLSVLYNVLKKEVEKFFKDYEYHPDWYGENIINVHQIEDFLKKSPSISLIGHYDPVGQVFEKLDVQPISEKVIVIDGSNVAWGSANRAEGEKPKLQNIMKVIVELNSRGFKDIIVIVDAALRHQVQDKERFEELESMGVIKTAPAKRDADTFIIKYAKERHARIISNDQYNNWKSEDEWVRAHIDNHRVTFMDINGNVQFDDNLK